LEISKKANIPRQNRLKKEEKQPTNIRRRNDGSVICVTHFWGRGSIWLEMHMLSELAIPLRGTCPQRYSDRYSKDMVSTRKNWAQQRDRAGAPPSLPCQTPLWWTVMEAGVTGKKRAPLPSLQAFAAGLGSGSESERQPPSPKERKRGARVWRARSPQMGESKAAIQPTENIHCSSPCVSTALK
jgi:hypothetical protein